MPIQAEGVLQEEYYRVVRERDGVREREQRLEEELRGRDVTRGRTGSLEEEVGVERARVDNLHSGPTDQGGG